MTDADIERAFTYHAPIKDQPERYVKLRETAKGLALLIQKSCPESREKSISLTYLQQSIQMANASIAIHETEEAGQP